jgi:hypothetical protein
MTVGEARLEYSRASLTTASREACGITVLKNKSDELKASVTVEFPFSSEETCSQDIIGAVFYIHKP